MRRWTGDARIILENKRLSEEIIRSRLLLVPVVDTAEVRDLSIPGRGERRFGSTRTTTRLAIHDDGFGLVARREFFDLRHLGIHLIDGNVDGFVEMPFVVFVRRPDIEEHGAFPDELSGQCGITIGQTRRLRRIGRRCGRGFFGTTLERRETRRKRKNEGNDGRAMDVHDGPRQKEMRSSYHPHRPLS